MAENTIYEEALELWGVDAQVKMAIEECAERTSNTKFIDVSRLEAKKC